MTMKLWNQSFSPFTSRFYDIGSLQQTAVTPQWADHEKASNYSDCSISFVIEHHQLPLLLVEIKPPSDFESDSGRDLAIM